MTADAALDPSADLLAAVQGQSYACILADPPWQFVNRTGKMAPEHKRLSRYGTMDLATIAALPAKKISASTAHL
jgi:N6-adenosine-specific RNA methylase IME4